MKIDIVDMDQLVAINKLQPITSHHMFGSGKLMFDSQGILSNEIFGISKDDRKLTFAYIDLKRKFIHPHIYAKVLKKIFKGIIYIVSGQKKYSIQDGLPVEDPNGWTGIEGFYEHWDEIDWSKSKSADKTNKELLMIINKERVFIDKFLVTPPAYRDVMLAGNVDSSDHTNKINDLYQRVIRSVAMLQEGGLFARHQYGTQYKIQEYLVEIYDYYRNLISHKQGIIRRNLIGKSVDYGSRSVISGATFNHDRLEDNMVDMEHSAVSISACCSNFYPFIEAWIKNFFRREILNDPNAIMYYDEERKREFTAQLVDVDVQFSDKNIKKMINDYMLNPDDRFKVLKVKVRVGTKDVEVPMIMKGKIILPNNSTKVLNRAMTYTDLLYLACVDICEEKRHIMVSRYPVGTDKGIYFSKIRVQSTAKHVKLIFNGKEYPYYPDIDFTVDHDKVGVQFIDTLVMSNAHLDGMGELKIVGAHVKLLELREVSYILINRG